MWMGDPFLMLAEEHKRDLYDDARHYALLREAGAGRRSGRTDGILGWIGRRRDPVEAGAASHPAARAGVRGAGRSRSGCGGTPAGRLKQRVDLTRAIRRGAGGGSPIAFKGRWRDGAGRLLNYRVPK